FCFEAFLPTDKKEKRKILEELKYDTRTLILYEAPHRLKKTLNELLEELGDRTITIVKELTKKHENVWKTSISEAVNIYSEQEPRGEYVLIIEGKSYEEMDRENKSQWESISIEDHVSLYMKQGLDKKSAMKAVAKDRGLSKREIYQSMLK
ncbi:MAG: 16S rRNA (cytidine(1402)-2'-O)-methyltransferase, partial [Clostridiales bacterium]|nr:16S rRNA (cytidine(1402)-2'-O)-methyltransferase [Clostridiales bacterium]